MLQLVSTDTIAAIATAPGRGAVGLIRISGTAARDIGRAIFHSEAIHREVQLRSFYLDDNSPIDRGLVLFFEGPASYTGEDLLELHTHGSQVVLGALLQRACELGARVARPGEFTERAFLNGKLDLAQAEAVADLIDAGSEQAARSAQRSLGGEFSAMVGSVADQLMAVRTVLEACLDFPDEEIDPVQDTDLSERLNALVESLRASLAKTKTGQRMRDGVRLVISGAPNVGKSSLLNCLVSEDVAIVSDTPGTTRDPVRSRFDINGLVFDIVDTAGLRETADRIEAEGIRRTQQEIANADLELLVCDARDLPNSDVSQWVQTLNVNPDPPPLGRIIALNKIDLVDKQAQIANTITSQNGQSEQLDPQPKPEPSPMVALSALTGVGVQELRETLLLRAGFHVAGESTFSARARHVQALQEALTASLDAQVALVQAGGLELVAEELRLVQQHLGEVTGHVTSDELLGRIFSTFCIGK